MRADQRLHHSRRTFRARRADGRAAQLLRTARAGNRRRHFRLQDGRRSPRGRPLFTAPELQRPGAL